MKKAALCFAVRSSHERSSCCFTGQASSRSNKQEENCGVLRFIFGLFQSSSDEVQDPMSQSCSTCSTDPCRADLLNKHSPAQHATMQLTIKIAARLPRRKKKKTENRKQTNNCKNTLSSSGLPAVTMDLHFFLFRALRSQKNNLKWPKKNHLEHVWAMPRKKKKKKKPRIKDKERTVRCSEHRHTHRDYTRRETTRDAGTETHMRARERRRRRKGSFKNESKKSGFLWLKPH